MSNIKIIDAHNQNISEMFALLFLIQTISGTNNRGLSPSLIRI